MQSTPTDLSACPKCGDCNWIDIYDVGYTEPEDNTAWENTVTALRMHFIQGNSQVPNIREHIEKMIVETLTEIRQSKGKTNEKVRAVPRR